MVKKSIKKERRKILVQTQEKCLQRHKTANAEKIPEGDVHIPNKWKRQELVGRQYREKKKVKRETRKQRQEARARGEEVDVPVTTTIEMMREADVTMLPPEGDEEVRADERMDEFSNNQLVVKMETDS
ncbi:conserved hypothetical protein [Perkinsus marinus ATCC 50983]|uniref:Uncharacterized protein n=1 Tax=Perkinsus marinus (strain ATCC 50983 / TXsc) TaxID=423536 RepID=C5KR05_PERM5|nr:conserved hypothetical protein [Perkinsus marinus ATCC 50983]EER13089.1 conserved hypothetical protein [Perkinsus marinus ATCC 50983]|eukprot:XP_002781294.1 conserved hypothetical protein [Perkinsus marinus ATCC 50983]